MIATSTTLSDIRAEMVARLRPGDLVGMGRGPFSVGAWSRPLTSEERHGDRTSLAPGTPGVFVCTVMHPRYAHNDPDETVPWCAVIIGDRLFWCTALERIERL